MAARTMLRRDQVLISACVALVTILAWAYLLRLDHQMSAGLQYDAMMAAMGMTVNRAWTGLDALLTFAMWSVMMVGMMAPSALPMLLMFGSAQAGRSQKSVSPRTLTFGLGYIAVWTGFSAVATLAQYELHKAALLSPAMASSSKTLTGAILLATGAYQMTGWKARCLTQCRSPLGFLMTNWRDGVFGAFQMGFRHGIFCLGCCWALMCLLFVVGIMNLIWIAVLTGVVLLEKIGPAGAIAARIVGVAMVVLGVAVLV